MRIDTLVSNSPGHEQQGLKKFLLSGSKNKFSNFPAEQLQNFLQLEALYLMFVIPLKSSEDSLDRKMKRNKRFTEKGDVDYKFY